MSHLNIGDAIHVKEIQLPEGVKTRISPDLTVFSVVAPTVEEEPVAEVVTAPEVITEKKEGAEAGAAPAAATPAAPAKEAKK